MEIHISSKGKKASIMVYGSGKNTAKQIAETYLQVKQLLEKGGVKCQ